MHPSIQPVTTFIVGGWALKLAFGAGTAIESMVTVEAGQLQHQTFLEIAISQFVGIFATCSIFRNG